MHYIYAFCFGNKQALKSFSVHRITHINTGKGRYELQFYVQENAHTTLSTDLEKAVFKRKVTYSLKFTYILIAAISDL